MGKLEPSWVADGIVKWYNHFGEPHVAVPQSVKHRANPDTESGSLIAGSWEGRECTVTASEHGNFLLSVKIFRNCMWCQLYSCVKDCRTGIVHIQRVNSVASALSISKASVGKTKCVPKDLSERQTLPVSDWLPSKGPLANNGAHHPFLGFLVSPRMA